MPLNFPNAPVANDTYTYSGTTYAYDGQKWTSRGAQTGIALLPDENGNVIITGNLTVQGATTALDGALTVGTTTEVTGDLTVTGDINDA